jgi:hypothetical protein
MVVRSAAAARIDLALCPDKLAPAYECLPEPALNVRRAELPRAAVASPCGGHGFRFAPLAQIQVARTRFTRADACA